MGTPPQQQSPTTAETLVDGAIHPELIPDSTAYRLWLLTVSTKPNPTTEDNPRQKSHLAMIGLLPDDSQRVMVVLANFRSQYGNLVSRYNESARAAISQNAQPDIKTLLQQRDDLVQRTRDALKQALTVDGMRRLDAYVQGEKKKMKIDAKEAQQ